MQTRRQKVMLRSLGAVLAGLALLGLVGPSIFGLAQDDNRPNDLTSNDDGVSASQTCAAGAGACCCAAKKQAGAASAQRQTGDSEKKEKKMMYEMKAMNSQKAVSGADEN